MIYLKMSQNFYKAERQIKRNKWLSDFKDLFDQGVTYSEIGAKHGISGSSASAYIKVGQDRQDRRMRR